MRALLLCALLLAPAFGGEPLDRLVPDTTVFYVSLENAGRTRERFQTSRLHALWNDPAMQAFLEKALGRWSSWMEELRKEEGASLEEMFSVVEGRLAMAITKLEMKEGGDVGGVIVADVGSNAEKLKELIDRNERILLEGDKHRRFDEEFRGVTLVSYKGEEDEEDDGGSDCWFLDGGTFALGSDLEELRELLVRREDPEAATLANHEPYRRVLARTGERTDLVVYLGCAAILRDLAAEGGPFGGEAGVLAALGLADIDAVGMQASFEREGLATRLFLSAPGEKEGILKLFAAQNSALVPPAFVAEDVTAASTMSLDIPAVWQEVRRVGNKIDPAFGATIDGMVEFGKGMVGIDVEKDVIGSLGKEITWYVRTAGGPAPAEPGRVAFTIPSVVVAIEVTDKQKFEGALNILAQVGQARQMLQVEEYLGVKVYESMLPMPVSPAFAVLPGRFVFATKADDLKEVVGRYGKDVKGLRDGEDFARAQERAPQGRIYLNFTREAKAFRQSMILNLVSMNRDARELFDIRLLPTEEVLEKYLDVGSSAIVNDEDGILVTSFTGFKPAPAEEEGEE